LGFNRPRLPVSFASSIFAAVLALSPPSSSGGVQRDASGSAEDASAESGIESTAESTEAPAEHSPRRARWHRYLERDVANSFHMLDHGVLAPEIAVGTPHLYRVGLRVGLFDHLTLGATMHWLPGEKVPVWSPLVAIAFYRGRIFEVGAHYERVLYRPPVADLDAETISFQQRADLLLGSISLSQGLFAAGFDLGWARGLEADPLPESGDELNQTPIPRDRLAAGLHLRVGNRRWGVKARLSYPFLLAEIGVELRFGLFERRPLGRWWSRSSTAQGDAP